MSWTDLWKLSFTMFAFAAKNTPPPAKMAMPLAWCQSALMTSARLFLANCLLWLFTLTSPAIAAINLTMADLQNGIGNGLTKGLYTEGDLAHATLHGLVGCAAGEALGGNCGAGFAAGVAQSVYAGMVDGTDPDKSDVAAYNAWRQEVSEQTKLIGGTVGYLTSGGRAANVSNDGSIAQSCVVHNYLTHEQVTTSQTCCRIVKQMNAAVTLLRTIAI